MKTLKELQQQVSDQQRELEMRTALCALIPEKYAMCFKSTHIDSGYSMGEIIYYTCNGKEIYRKDNREYYTGRGAKYNPTHGSIFINFTKKALLEYCKLCYNIRVRQIKGDFKATVELAEKKRELLKKCISAGSKVKEIYIAL